VIRTAFICVLACFFGYANAAELVVHSTVAARDIVEHLRPEFEKTTGHRLIVEYGSGAEVQKRAEAGVPFDVLIIPNPGMMKLSKEGVITGSGKPIGVAHLVIAYKHGEIPPAVDTPENVKVTIERATSFAMSDPAKGGLGPVFLTTTAKSLGVEEVLRKKTRLAKAGEAGKEVAESRAQYGVAQTTEISQLKGRVDGAHLLPSDPRSMTVFMAGVASRAPNGTMAEKFVDLLTSPEHAKWREEEMGFSEH
jgi:molybdate transport system substrate-binding protein